VAAEPAYSGYILGPTIGLSNRITDYFFGDGSNEAEEVEDTANSLNIYQTFETAMLSQRSAIVNQGEEVGVDNGSEPSSLGANLTHPADNGVAHSITEHSYARASQEWDAGASLSECQQAAREAARIVSVQAEWNTIALWNDWVQGSLNALDAHFRQFGHSEEVLEIVNSRPGDAIAPASSNHHYQYSATPDNDDSLGIIGYRDLSNSLPLDPANLEEGPDKWVVLELMVPNDDPDEFSYVVSPYTGISTPDSQLSMSSPHHDASNYSAGTEPFSYSAETISVSNSGATISIETWRIQELLYAHRKIRSNIINDLDADIETVYNGLESGQISIDDVLSGRQLYQQYEPPKGMSRTVVELISMGHLSAPDDLVARVEATIDGQTLIGVLLIELSDGVNSLTISEGDTISAADYTEAYLVPEEQSAPVTTTGTDIQISKVYNDSGEITYEARERFSASSPDQSKIDDRLKQNREQMNELEEMIQGLEAGGGGGGSGDIGIEELAAAVGVGGILAFLLGGD
jgi:hypothetical protein